MALEREISKWGNAAAIRLPSTLLAQLGLTVSSRVRIEVQKGALVITPLEVREPRLEYLLQDARPEQFRVEDDDDWLNDGPVGQELL
ncbi:MAG: AbrB/MazE/SpoVT family DNA-binding domain-containing protein [Alcanivoracaceae bacterium]|jgi:antitoxin component of MazEF toxin-antitoxin module|nr:AbrB/MazE/SpoVT family DNA-binding domain-containing protein [Alcanivoracaceae bacterium]